MNLSRFKEVFVHASAVAMLLATQSQSCSAKGNDPIALPPADGSGATGGQAPYDGGGSPPNSWETRVAIVQSPTPAAAITQPEIDGMVRQAVDLAGGLDGIIQDGMTVVLKPNLVQPFDFTGGSNWQPGPWLVPEANGVCTDYRVTRAVVQLVRELNPSGLVYVMEGTAGNGDPANPTEKTISSTDQVFQRLNYTPDHIPGVNAFLAIEADSAQPGGYQMVPVAGLLGNSYAVNTNYLNAHVVISLPTLKTHYQAVVSGAVKNVGIGATPASYYGNPGDNWGNALVRMSMVDHYSIALHHWIHDYYLARPVSFVVMDGLQGIQNGPVPSTAVSGTTNIAQDQMNMRLIMAGMDAVAVDTIESLVMGWDPQSVEYLRALGASGAGTIETANIRVLGNRVATLRSQFFTPPTGFAYGGQQIPDLLPPNILVLGGPQVADGWLTLSLQADDLRKVEVYLNSQLIEPTVVGGFEAISMDVRHLPPGTYNVELIGYDYYMNETVLPAGQAMIQ